MDLRKFHKEVSGQVLQEGNLFRLTMAKMRAFSQGVPDFGRLLSMMSVSCSWKCF